LELNCFPSSRNYRPSLCLAGDTKVPQSSSPSERDIRLLGRLPANGILMQNARGDGADDEHSRSRGNLRRDPMPWHA